MKKKISTIYLAACACLLRTSIQAGSDCAGSEGDSGASHMETVCERVMDKEGRGYLVQNRMVGMLYYRTPEVSTSKILNTKIDIKTALY